MDMWKNKENFFEHLEILQKIGKNFKKKKRHIKRNTEAIKRFELETNANWHYLNQIKIKMSDKLFDYLKYYKLNLSIFDIFVILATEAEWELFKKSKMSSDGYQYNRQIRGLKEGIDYTTKFAMNDSKIKHKLPILPHVTLTALYDYLSKRNMKNIRIYEILDYFLVEPRKRRSRSDTELSNKIKEVSREIEAELSSKPEQDPEKIITLINDKLDENLFYTAKDANFTTPPFKAI